MTLFEDEGVPDYIRIDGVHYRVHDIKKTDEIYCGHKRNGTQRVIGWNAEWTISTATPEDLVVIKNRETVRGVMTQ